MKIILSIALFLSASFGGMSEKDALIRALSHNPDIKLNHSKISYDSLSLNAAKAGWLPELSFSFSPELTIIDTAITSSTRELIDSLRLLRNSASDSEATYYSSYIQYLLDQNNRAPAGNIKNNIKLTQPIIGGGVLSATYGNISNKIFENSYSDFSNSLQLTFNQPLLNSAWKFSEPKYGITIQTLENNQTSLQTRKSILSTLSEVRSLYWDYYAQQIYTDTYKREVARNLILLNTARSNFNLGEVSVLDTLNASYNYINSQQKLLDSDISFRKARNKLSLALSLSSDSITIIDSLPIIIPDLPDPVTLISLSKKYDQSLKVFETISEKLQLQQQKNRNSLLPTLDATASVTFDRSGNSYLSDNAFANNAVVGLVFSYLLPRRKNLISRKQTDLQITDNSISQKKYLDELTIKLIELKESWDQEKQRIVLSEKSKEIAELQYLAAQKEYSIGTIERISLIDTQDKLVDSELTLTKNRIEMKKLEIILDEITGTLFQRFNLNIN